MKPTIEYLSLAVIALSLHCAAASAEQTLIYKTVDADGYTVFTDQQIPEATVVTPSPLNIMDVAPQTDPVHRDTNSSGTTTLVSLDQVSIVSPAHEQTFIDPQSGLWVEFTTAPAGVLPVELTAQVLLDGTVISAGSSNRLPIDIPERGTHSVQVRVTDQQGVVQLQSEVITIHVRHHITGTAN